MSVTVVDKIVGNLIECAHGDGVSTVFMPDIIAPLPTANTTYYKMDWQGIYQIYPTQRTNRWLRSSALGTAPNICSAGTGATITGTAGIAPDGTNTAWKLAEDAQTSAHYLYQSIAMSAGLASTTIYIKAVERAWAKLELDAGVQYGWVNLITGEVGTTAGGASIVTSLVQDGWWKCTVSGTITAATHATAIGAATGNGNTGYAGVAGNGILIWHPQNEPGGIGTSDIPTVASPVSVTDYTISAAGLITLATPLTAGQPLMRKLFNEYGIVL
jgi:hypothetical protein